MQTKAEVTETSPPAQPIPEDRLKELETGKEPEHFVTLEIDGRMGKGIYLTKGFEPTSKDRAELLKVVFDDGGVSFFTAS